MVQRCQYVGFQLSLSLLVTLCIKKTNEVLFTNAASDYLIAVYASSGPDCVLPNLLIATLALDLFGY